MITSPIQEVFEEIIKDGLTETIIENLIDIAGGSEDLAFWLSSYFTSKREVNGALGTLARIGGSTTSTTSSPNLAQSISTDDTSAILSSVQQDAAQQQAVTQQDQEDNGIWSSILKSNLLKGLFMVAVPLFLNTFSFVGMIGLSKVISGTIKLSPVAFSEYKSWQHNKRKDFIVDTVGTEASFSKDSMFTDVMKKPSELDNVKPELNEQFKAQQEARQEAEKDSTPFVKLLTEINYNPKTKSKEALADTFNTIMFEGYFNEWVEEYLLKDERFRAFKTKFKQIQRNYEEMGFQRAEKEAINIIKESLKLDKFNLRFLNMFGVEFYDPDFVLIGAPSHTSKSQGSRVWKQNAFEAKMTTLDKVNEIKSYFGVSGDYAMYLKAKDGQLISIPVDTTILADWLTSNHHSIDSKIYVAPNQLKTEQFHTLDNWENHPSYILQTNIKSLFSIEFDKEFYQLLGISEGIFSYHNKKLKKGLNSLFTDRTLYQWLYKVENNPLIAKDKKIAFKVLITNYRTFNGLKYQDPAIDTLVGALRMAIQNDPDIDTPSDRKLSDFLNLDPNQNLKIFRRGSRTLLFQPDHILKMVYGLYRKSSTKFILDNFGKISTFTLGRTPRAVRKALMAINIYCESKGYINFGEASPLQKLITASSWHLSDIENGGRYLTRSELGNLVNLPTATVERMLKGERDNVRNRDYLQNIRNVVSDLNNQLRETQMTLLRQLYGDFETDNADNYPGVHDVQLKYLSDPDKVDYHDFFKIGVRAKHVVELLIRQGGLMPAGFSGEGAQNFDIERVKKYARHHINFFKASNNVNDLIILGDLHATLRHREVMKDLDYYTIMRGMRDDFQNARPPSLWDTDLQDLYIERLKEFVIGWETTGTIKYTRRLGPPTYVFVNGQWVIEKMVDFIKVNINGKTYDLQLMLDEDLITTDFVDDIIQDIRQKLESRGLM